MIIDFFSFNSIKVIDVGRMLMAPKEIVTNYI